jgi:hypothetical protein
MCADKMTFHCSLFKAAVYTGKINKLRECPMNVFQMVFGIVVASLVGTILILKQIAKLKTQPPIENDKQLQEKVDNLEARIQTLERIATDSKTTLTDKINAL